MGNSAFKKHCETAQKTGALNISKGKLDEFPSEMKTLYNVLRSLDLSENKFSNLPSEIGKFISLKTLTINKNKLSTLPHEIGFLVKLESLSASNNVIQILPNSISALSNLKQVNLSHNQLEKFPIVFCGLRHLDILDLSNNKITEIPDRIDEIFVFELNLNSNQVSSINENISKCPKLKTLRLQENYLELKGIPVSLLKNSSVSKIDLENNLFQIKDFALIDGYENYMERYTSTRKKMF